MSSGRAGAALSSIGARFADAIGAASERAEAESRIKNNEAQAAYWNSKAKTAAQNANSTRTAGDGTGASVRRPAKKAPAKVKDRFTQRDIRGKRQQFAGTPRDQMEQYLPEWYVELVKTMDLAGFSAMGVMDTLRKKRPKRKFTTGRYQTR